MSIWDGAGGAGGAGSDGKSAYEIAVENNFVGTEEAWLASLVGEDGLPGAPGGNGLPGAEGKSAYEVALENNFVGTEEAWLASLIGKDGAPGENGLPGAQGIQGEVGLTGPQGSSGESYEGYSLYRESQDVWGVFTVLRFKDASTNMRRLVTFSGGTAPFYTTKTVVDYATNGVDVVLTRVYTLTYVDYEIVSEVLV